MSLDFTNPKTKTKKMQMNSEVVEEMIRTSIGPAGGVSIYEIVTWCFGKKRTREAFKNPYNDPELIDFVMLIDAKVNKAWEKRGVSRIMGPFVK